LSAVEPERADDAGTPAGDMSGVVLAPETTTSVASQQRANPKRTDDADTLARDVSDICLAPEITTHSVPDATSPPSINQEVPSVFTLFPLGSASIRQATPLR
jgi:capsular polysaccharide biosynthesis protein